MRLQKRERTDDAITEGKLVRSCDALIAGNGRVHAGNRLRKCKARYIPQALVYIVGYDPLWVDNNYWQVAIERQSFEKTGQLVWGVGSVKRWHRYRGPCSVPSSVLSEIQAAGGTQARNVDHEG